MVFFLSVSWPLHLSISGVKYRGEEMRQSPRGIPDKLERRSLPSPSGLRELVSWEQVELGVGRNVGPWVTSGILTDETRALPCAPRTREPSSQLSLTPQRSIQQMFFSLSLDLETGLRLGMRRNEAETLL